MTSIAHTIANQFSVRPPPRKSLEILARILTSLEL